MRLRCVNDILQFKSASEKATYASITFTRSVCIKAKSKCVNIYLPVSMLYIAREVFFGSFVDTINNNFFSRFFFRCVCAPHFHKNLSAFHFCVCVCRKTKQIETNEQFISVFMLFHLFILLLLFGEG